MVTIYRLLLAAAMLLATICHAYASMPSTTEAQKLKAQADRYYGSGRYPLALTYYIKGMDAAESEGDERTVMACIGNIANIYETTGDYESNLFYLLKGYNMAKEHHDNDIRLKFLINIVSAYCQLGNVDKAKEYFNISQNADVSGNNTLHRYFTLYNSARIMQAEGRYADAAKEHGKALEYAKANGLDNIYRLYQKSEIGNLCIKMEDYGKAINYGHECEEMSARMDDAEMLVNAYGMLSKAYEGACVEDSARKYRNLYLELTDSLFHGREINKAKGRLKEYESLKNNERISLLTSTISMQTLAIVLVSCLLAVSAILVAMLIRKNRNLRNVQRLLIARNNDLTKSYANNNALMTANGNAASQTCDGDDSDGQGLTPEQANALLSKIICITDDPAVLANPELSLKMVADMAESNTRYVSLVINKTYNKNFRTFINEKRIRKACEMLTDTQNYGNKTMQAIYEEAGFTNAASFIRAFKKVNGMTPAMYKKLAAD